MAKTLRDKFSEALTIEGYQIVASRSSKYVVFKRTEGSYWYIGKSGSLRIGATIASSIPAKDKFKEYLLNRVEQRKHECPHCKWGFANETILAQHVAEKH